jgi:hypothetical protein
MLLPRRTSAFWEGHNKSSTAFQRICWEEPEKQKTRSCRAQELSRSRAQWKGWKRHMDRNNSNRRHGKQKARKKREG